MKETSRFKVPSSRFELRSSKLPFWLAVSVSLLTGVTNFAAGGEIAALVADRAATERVYYDRRTGTKPAFEEALPGEQVRHLVEQDLAKEAVLKTVYGIEVTPAMVAAELQRINATTHAPDILAELKAALGNDAARFARTVAKPIIVERLLRNRFENDDKLHAPQRRHAEQLREQLLAAAKLENNRDVSNLVGILKSAGVGQFSETTWQFGARVAETNQPNEDLFEIRSKFGPNAQLLSSPSRGNDERKFYFNELPPGLQRVLRAQLRQAGDVSALIETPGGFLLYVCTGKTTRTLSAATLFLSKRSYEQWLAEKTANRQ